MSETTRRYTIDRRPRVQPGMSKADFDAAVYGRTFPALDGGTVTQGHADWCAKHGHATHKVDGELASMYCIRCGAPLPEAADEADELAGMAAAVEGIDFSAAVEKAAALIASRSEREAEAKLDELELTDSAALGELAALRVAARITLVVADYQPSNHRGSLPTVRFRTIEGDGVAARLPFGRGIRPRIGQTVTFTAKRVHDRGADAFGGRFDLDGVTDWTVQA